MRKFVEDLVAIQGKFLIHTTYGDTVFSTDHNYFVMQGVVQNLNTNWILNTPILGLNYTEVRLYLVSLPSFDLMFLGLYIILD
ncbi:hypothetical protein QJS10_CPA06g00244 [Acorus calamus]|uniref:Uncharacterized protein n=1 Tax=Acorus calamus TaxID=4465 RepID=A0AAV9ERF9_ACOCL|nr:hypothetical protein QJS10_CPA06g00244 [Acorus calamus]